MKSTPIGEGMDKYEIHVEYEAVEDDEPVMGEYSVRYWAVDFAHAIEQLMNDPSPATADNIYLIKVEKL